MKTNQLAKTTLVDDGECVSFHHFSPALDTSSFVYDGYELLVLPGCSYEFWVAGETFALTGSQVILLGPELKHGWRRSAGGHSAAGCRTSEEDGQAIRWPADLLGEGLLGKRQTQAIAELLEMTARGVRFEAGVLPLVCRRLEVLRGRTGFAIYLVYWNCCTSFRMPVRTIWCVSCLRRRPPAPLLPLKKKVGSRR